MNPNIESQQQLILAHLELCYLKVPSYVSNGGKRIFCEWDNMVLVRKRSEEHMHSILRILESRQNTTTSQTVYTHSLSFPSYYPPLHRWSFSCLDGGGSCFQWTQLSLTSANVVVRRLRSSPTYTNTRSHLACECTAVRVTHLATMAWAPPRVLASNINRLIFGIRRYWASVQVLFRFQSHHQFRQTLYNIRWNDFCCSTPLPLRSWTISAKRNALVRAVRVMKWFSTDKNVWARNEFMHILVHHMLSLSLRSKLTTS